MWQQARNTFNRSEVGVIQSFKIELLLKHLKHAKNHQTLQAVSQKQDFPRKMKNSLAILDTKSIADGIGDCTIESSIFKLVGNHSTFVENGCACGAMQH